MSEVIRTIALERSVLRTMERHAIEAYPEECCGVLLGNEHDGEHREIVDILEITNARSDNRARRFLVTPDDYRYAEEQARTRHCSLVGWYHSHPDHPAQPSEFDREHALPWFSYVIISVMRGATDAVRSWRLTDDRSGYTEENVEMHTGQSTS
jgi:proteasome lid subunit RPN8/RPN11